MSATNSHFKFDTTGDEVVTTFPSQVTGRTFLVTGPNPTGIGATTLTSLAKAKPAALILAGRTPARFQSISDEIARIDPNIVVVPVALDLSSQKSVRAAAKAILEDERIKAIDVVINNAAVMACPLARTEEGVELQIGTNHIGHFLLTNLILSKITATSNPVIVNVASSGHRFFSGNYDDINWEKTPYDTWTSYGQSKAANYFFTRSLVKRGIRSIAVHPGWIKSDLARHTDDDSMTEFLARAGAIPDFDPLDFIKNLDQGCSTSLVAALDQSIPSGSYIRDCQVALPAVSVRERDDIAETLWGLSNKLVGENFA